MAWGVLAIVVNVALVVGVVLLLSGRDSSEVAERPPSPSPTASSASSRSPSPSPSTSPSSSTTGSLFTRESATTVAVLGDQTSDGQGEWVGIFGELLGRDHRVTVHRLDPADPTVYVQKQAYGSSGPVVTIYNGSRPGAVADYGARRLGFLSPKAPDLVVLNYGRNDDADDVAARLTATTRAMRAAWPKALVAVTLQPPTADDASKNVRSAVQAWAGTSGVRTLDVARTFLDTGEPDTYVSSRDGTVMSARGDRLWGRTAYRLLVGSDPPALPTAPGPSPSESVTTEPALEPSTSTPRGTSRPRTTTPPRSTTGPTTSAPDPSPTPSPTQEPDPSITLGPVTPTATLPPEPPPPGP